MRRRARGEKRGEERERERGEIGSRKILLIEIPRI